MNWRIKEVVRELQDANRHGVIRGEDIHVDGVERSAVIRVANSLDSAWFAGDDRIDIHGGADWSYRLVQDVIAWIDKGEKVYRDLPIRRRR